MITTADKLNMVKGERAKEQGTRFFIHLRHCVTPPPAEDKKIGARDEEQGARFRVQGKWASHCQAGAIRSLLAPLVIMR